ncbi:MAG: type II secretion system protein M, partial [Betaproteobacteria bacterium]|nr:type II secretion system protein M [Betaproteobacteria bacterium]
MSRWDLRPWHARWEQLSVRERTGLRAAALVLALALLWQVGLDPALRVWQQSPERHAQLDRQHAQLAALQAQARSLQAQPRLSRQEAQQSLSQLTRDLLPGAQLSQQGDATRVVLKNVSGSSLAQWL